MMSNCVSRSAKPPPYFVAIIHCPGVEGAPSGGTVLLSESQRQDEIQNSSRLIIMRSGIGLHSKFRNGISSCEDLESRVQNKIARRTSRSCGLSLGPDEIEEYAFVVVLEVGQVVGEIGEVVADANLQVLADAMIDRCQCAATGLVEIRQAKRSHFGQALPLLEEPPFHAEYCELRWVLEE